MSLPNRREFHDSPNRLVSIAIGEYVEYRKLVDRLWVSFLDTPKLVI